MDVVMNGFGGIISRKQVENLLRAACKYTSNTTNITVEISMVSDAESKKLNKRFRKKDTPTDVLSFGYKNTPDDNPEYEDSFLGELIIACGVAQKQARELGHGLERELMFLIVHGFLHLLGYDHSRSHDKKKMLALQDKIIHSV